MDDKIALSDIKLKYATIPEAKAMPGLRLILGANAVPGPWREACKGILHVKKISYTPVASAGQDRSQRELYVRTALSNAPVAIWEYEQTRSRWIVHLALGPRHLFGRICGADTAVATRDVSDGVVVSRGIHGEKSGDRGRAIDFVSGTSRLHLPRVSRIADRLLDRN